MRSREIQNRTFYWKSVYYYIFKVHFIISCIFFLFLIFYFFNIYLFWMQIFYMKIYEIDLLILKIDSLISVWLMKNCIWIRSVRAVDELVK